jgi:hypothetical protein
VVDNATRGFRGTCPLGPAVVWLAAYLRDQREHFVSSAVPLGQDHLDVLAPYFPAALLDRVRVVELKGVRVRAPHIFAEARALGFDNLPDVTHMDSVTFLDVLVFNETLTRQSLFHALVHSVQLQVLGLEQYSELWIRGFLKTRADFTVPLEVHAFSMASRFVRPEVEKFLVEDEVLRWTADGRY